MEDLASIMRTAAELFGAGGIGILLGVFVDRRSKARKASAEADGEQASAEKTGAEADEIQVRVLAAIIERLEHEVTRLQEQMTDLRERVNRLEQMYRLGRDLVRDLFSDLKTFGAVILKHGGALPFEPKQRYTERVCEFLGEEKQG